MYSRSSQAFRFIQYSKICPSPNIRTLIPYNKYDLEYIVPLTINVRTLFTSNRCDKSVDLVVKKAEDLIKAQNIKRLKKIFKCTDVMASIAYSALQLPKTSLSGKAENNKQFKTFFKCSDDEASKARAAMQLPESSLDDIERKVKWLISQNATLPVILKNCELLLRPLDLIIKSYKLLRGLPWKKTDDFLPLLIMSDDKILRLRAADRNCFTNRIYELAEVFSFEPEIVSKYCAKHPFIFELQYELFRTKLKLALDRNIQPDAILRDLDILRRSEEILKKRLDFLTENGIEHIMPWMAKCSDETIKRTIELRNSRDAKQNEIADYLSSKLNLHALTAIRLFKKHTFLSKIDLNEISPLVNLLLKVFTPEQITENISILNCKLPEIKRRIGELESFNGTNLKCLMLSRTSFENYLEEMKNSKDR